MEKRDKEEHNTASKMLDLVQMQNDSSIDDYVTSNRDHVPNHLKKEIKIE
jgi:hypothetical protein